MRPSHLSLWLPVALISGLLLWTAAGIRSLDTGDPSNLWYQRHYEYLAEGFARGRLSLSLEPAPGLLRLADPYDPARNLPFRLWDASLYHGKYYLYYGPAPALLLMLPLRLATGWMVPQWLAVALFSCAGIAGLALLAWEIRNRFFPGAPSWLLGVTIFTATTATWIPVTIRWPSVWSLPVVSACACLWWTLYFLWRFHLQGRTAPWAVLSGLGLGFLLASRATYLFAAAGLLGFHLLPRSDPARPEGGRLRGLLVAGALAAAAGAALLAYNYARFGSIAEFGQSYQLWGDNQRHIRHFNPAFIPFNARLYFLSLPQLSPFFPFALGVFPAELPAGYLDVQEIHGILFALPVHLFGIGALAWAVSRKRGPSDRPLRRVLLAGALAAACSTGLLLCWAGATTRYITEILSGWAPLTAVGLLMVFGAPKSRAASVLKPLALAACLWSVLYTGCASAGYMGLFHRTNPEAYDAIASFLDRPSDLYARAAGKSFGPLELNVSLAPHSKSGTDVLVVSGRPGRMHELLIRRIDAGHARLVVAENDLATLVTPEFSTGSNPLHVRLEAPWLYPPAAHPYWQRQPQAAASSALQSRQVVTVNGVATRADTPHSYDAAGFAPLLVTRAMDPSAGAWIEP